MIVDYTVIYMDFVEEELSQFYPPPKTGYSLLPTKSLKFNMETLMPAKVLV